jgi:hypothetical protein
MGLRNVWCGQHDQGGVDILPAADHAKVREFVAENFARALPPVGEDTHASFKIEVNRVDDHTVGAGAGNAKKIAPFVGLLEGRGEAKGNVFELAVD